jgi:hypothetical protein
MFLITLAFVLFQDDDVEGHCAEADFEALRALEIPFVDICRNTWKLFVQGNVLFDKRVVIESEQIILNVCKCFVILFAFRLYIICFALDKTDTCNF